MLAVIVAGVVAGFTYSLAGASLAIAYRSSRTLNFALGGIGGFCAYVCLSLLHHQVPWVLALIVAMVVGAILGGATDWFVGRRLRQASALTAAMGLFGALLLVQGATEWIWGSNDTVMRGPFPLSSQVRFGAGVVVSDNALLSVALAAVVVAALLVFLYRTPYGLQMRAASGGPITAQTVGIRVRTTSAVGWAIGGGVGAVAAVFVNMTGTMLPTTFSGFIFLALVALTLGGMTSITGVVAGGLIFGVALNVAEAELTTKLTYVFAYIFLAALLFYRPTGLLGRPERRVSEPDLVARPTQRALMKSRWGGALYGLGAWRTGAMAGASAGTVTSRARARDVTGVIVVIGLMLLLWWDGPALVSLSLPQVLSMFVAVIGLDILMGYCGQVSLAHAAFLGVGAYGSAVAVVHLHLPLALAFPIGIFTSALVGVVVGLPAIRLSGLYFAQLTLLFALAVPELITFFSSVTGGSNGLSVPQFTSLSPFQTFLLYGAIAAAAALVARMMIRSSVGRHWRATRDNPEAAAGLGQNVSLTKLGAFAVGCGLAGLGGVMQAVAVGSLSPDSYPVWESIYLQAAQVVGGMTSLLGNLLGAFFVTIVPVYTGSSGVPSDFIFGAAFVAVLMVSPRGIGQIVNQLWASAWEAGAGALRLKPGQRAPDAVVTSGPVAVSVPLAMPVQPRSSGGAPQPASTPVGRAVPVLEVSDLSAGYGGGEVIHQIDLRIFPGECVAVVGPNGAGKSTLLRAITGFVLPSRGRIYLAGDDATGMSPYLVARAGVAHVVEGRGIFPDLSVAENLQLGGRSSSEGHQPLDEVLTLFPALGARIHQLGGTLSGGEQQMLALARALLMKPSLLILDEPLLGLAPGVADAVLDGLAHIPRDDVSVLVVEQNVRQVLALCDRAYVMAEGRIVRSGLPADLGADAELAETYFGLRAAAELQ